MTDTKDNSSRGVWVAYDPASSDHLSSTSVHSSEIHALRSAVKIGGQVVKVPADSTIHDAIMASAPTIKSHGGLISGGPIMPGAPVAVAEELPGEEYEPPKDEALPLPTPRGRKAGTGYTPKAS